MLKQKDIAHDTGVSFTYAITDYFEGLMKSRKKKIQEFWGYQWQGKCVINEYIFNKMNFTHVLRNDRS